MDSLVRQRALPAATGISASAALRLLLAAIGIGLPLFFALLAPQPPLWQDQPSAHPVLDPSAPTMGWSGIVLAVGFALFLCLPYHPYGLALRLLDRQRVSRRLLLGLTLLLAALGCLVYPHFGSDVFDYAAYERLWVVYGENPLFGIVANHAADWINPFVNVADRTPAYGPLWALLTWPIVRLASESALGLVVGYKMLAVSAYALCCWLIWSSVEPARRQRALVLFAWSPLVIFEVLGTLHNDVMVAVGLLAVVFLLGRQKTTPAWLAGVAGGLFKATAFAALPVLALMSLRRAGWRGLVPVMVGGALVVVLAYLPFWNGLETLSPVWHQTAGLGWSPATALTVAIAPLSGDAAGLIARVVLAVAWAAIVCLLLLRRRAEQPSELAASTGWLLIATLLLLTAAIYGHYFVPVVAMAAVSGERSLERAARWLSIGGLAAHGVGAIGWSLNPLWIGTLGYQVFGAAVLLGPAVLAALFSLWQLRSGAMSPAVVSTSDSRCSEASS
jgi:hypothetical protein